MLISGNTQQRLLVFYLLLAIALLEGIAFGGILDPVVQCPSQFRAGYIGIPTEKVLYGMSAVGMNAVMSKFGDLKVPISSLDVKRLGYWSEECRKRGLLFMPVIDWWGKNDAQLVGDYMPFVASDGRVLTKTPCPYSQPLWDNWIVPRLIGIVRTLERKPLAGLLIDVEMYGADYTGYHHISVCYCDSCFTRYMKTKSRSGPLPAYTDRAKTVANAGDSAFYSNLEQEVAKGMAESCRLAIHNLRPGLPIGVLQLDYDTPIQRGMALGFGTAERPVLCFSEMNYSKGYTPYIDSKQKEFERMGAHVDFIPGLWMRKYAPADFADQLCRCGANSSGYWIYTMESFSKQGYDPLPASPAEEWDAIKEANQCLDPALKLNQRP